MKYTEPADNLIPAFALVVLGVITFTGSMNMLSILCTLSYSTHPDLFIVIASLVIFMIAASLALFYASLPFFQKELEQCLIPDE